MVICGNREPVELPVKGIGKLRLNSGCKVCSKSAILQTHSLLKSNYSSKSNYFVTKLYLEYDCCEDLKSKVNLSSIHLNTEFWHILSHLNDLKVAIHKVSDI
jgi:hypothetical protein